MPTIDRERLLYCTNPCFKAQSNGVHNVQWSRVSLDEKSAIEQETFSLEDFFQNLSISTLKHKDWGHIWRKGEGGEKRMGVGLPVTLPKDSSE